jgi:predicted DNA-binding transcriptional regulator AlpA
MESVTKGKQPNPSAALWDLTTVLNEVNLSRSTWLKLCATGLAPKQRQIPGSRSVRWSADEVREWIGGLVK